MLFAYAQVTVESRIDSIQILVGDQTDITLTVKAKEGSRVVFPFFEPSQYITPGLEVLDCSKQDTIKVYDGFLSISRKYTLTAFDEKLYYIPSMNVTVDGKSYKTRSLALKVLTIPVDTLHPEKFYPPKDVQGNPFMWSEYSSVFWAGALSVLLFVLMYYLWTRLKENKPVITKIKFIKHVPPHQKALTEIEQIKANKMSASEDQKAYYTRLTDVLRKYIKERFGFNAMEMTSGEIIHHIQQEQDKKLVDELKDLFMTADLVKFAKYSALINENDSNLVNAIDFINTTKQDKPAEVEEIKPDFTETEKQSMRSRKTLKLVIVLVAAALAAVLVWIAYIVYLLL